MTTATMMAWGAIVTSILSALGFLAAFVIAYLSHDTTSQSLLVGAIITNFSTAVSFWLGSSSGSQKKDDQIAKLSEKP
jgi:hypothetical protein